MNNADHIVDVTGGEVIVDIEEGLRVKRRFIVDIYLEEVQDLRATSTRSDEAIKEAVWAEINKIINRHKEASH